MEQSTEEERQDMCEQPENWAETGLAQPTQKWKHPATMI
jgi:hypothetical protein